MSVVVWDGRMLAADRRVTDGSRIVGSVRKIERINNCLVGAVGSLRGATAMMTWFREGADPDRFPSITNADATEMLVIRPHFGGVWIYETSTYPYEMQELHVAIGSGDTTALVALACGKSAAEAVALCAQVCSDVGNGIDTLTFDAV